MWEKLPLLAGWLAIFVALNFALLAGLQLVRTHLEGWIGWILGEVFVLALMLMPFFNIWFLTGEFFSDAMLIIAIGTRITGLLSAGITRLITGAEQQVETVRGGMLVGALEPVLQNFFHGISRVMQVYGLLIIGTFSAAYLLLDARGAADFMLSFSLWSNPVVMLLFSGFGNLLLLSMPHLDEDLRESTFIQAAIGLAPIFMAVILTLYILHPGSMLATAFVVLGHGVPLYAAIAAAAFATFLAMVVAPYALGVRRGKKQRSKLFRRQKRAAARLADTLLAAHWTGDAEALKTAVDELKKTQRQLDEEHAVIAKSAELLEQLSDPEKAAQSPLERADIERFRSTDARVLLHAFVRQNIDNLGYAVDTLEQKRDVLEQRQVLDHFALENLRAQARAQDELTAVERSKPSLFGAIASTVAVVGSLALSLFGKMLFELIGRSVAFIL